MQKYVNENVWGIHTQEEPKSQASAEEESIETMEDESI
jgi:hypothetical protein